MQIILFVADHFDVGEITIFVYLCTKNDHIDYVFVY